MGLIQQYPHKEHIVKGITYLICHNEELTQKYLPSLLAYLFQKLQENAANRSKFKEMMYSLNGVVKVLQEEAPESATCIAITASFLRSAFPYMLEELKNPKKV